MPGTITGEDMRSDPNAYDKDDVVNKVAQTLSKFSDDDDSTLESTEESAEEQTSTLETEETEETQEAEETAEDETPTPEESEQKPAESEKQKPAIPDNYYRAAVHQGWKPEQIDKLYRADPDGTLEFLKQNHEKVNNLSQQFSLLGRKAREMEEQKKAEPPKPVVDSEAFRKAYDEDPAAAIADALNKVSTHKTVVQQQQPVQRDQQQEDLAAIEQVNGFLSGSDMEGFNDFYGVSKSYRWDDLTAGQYANRMAVIRRADEILAGAELLQTNITVRDALERAHLQVTAPILEKVVRNKIVSQVKKKAKGVTLRPAKSKTIAPSGAKTGQLTDDEIEERAKERLAKLGKK